MPDSRLRVAVTGAAGYVGGRLVARLQDCGAVEYVLATDIRKPSAPLAERVEFVRQDITKPFPRLFSERGIDSVVHLAYALAPSRNRELCRLVNIAGADHVIEAALNADAGRLIYLSSSSVYGAHPDNPEGLTEDDPVRPARGFQYSEDKVASEERLMEAASRRPSMAVAILRGCPVMGPHANNFIANAFMKPILPQLGDADPPMQFAHEDDMAETLARCLVAKPRGIYNVAGSGTIRWSEMARMMGRRALRLPPAAWRALVWAGWSLRAQSDSPACGLDFIRYRWTVSADKLRREVGIEPRRASKDAWESFAARVGGRKGT